MGDTWYQAGVGGGGGGHNGERGNTPWWAFDSPMQAVAVAVEFGVPPVVAAAVYKITIQYRILTAAGTAATATVSAGNVAAGSVLSGVYGAAPAAAGWGGIAGAAIIGYVGGSLLVVAFPRVGTIFGDTVADFLGY